MAGSEALADRFEEHRGRLQAVAYRMLAGFARSAELALLNGSVGVVDAPEGRVQSVMDVTVADGRITGMYILADPSGWSAWRCPASRADPGGGTSGHQPIVLVRPVR